MERYKSIRDQLIALVQGELGNAKEADAKELGEVVDMIKDMEEAMYYHSITKAMHEKEEEQKYSEKFKMMNPQQHFFTPYLKYIDPYLESRDMDYGRMYYTENSSNSGNSGGGIPSSGGNRGYSGQGRGQNAPRDSKGRYTYTIGPHNMSNVDIQGSYGFGNYPSEIRDYREGKSPMSRRGYMEGKENGHPKETQIQELEKYMKELCEDVTEMIEDASPEEKNLLYQKLTTLANKIQ